MSKEKRGEKLAVESHINPTKIHLILSK
jgi:hypothetical protein